MGSKLHCAKRWLSTIAGAECCLKGKQNQEVEEKCEDEGELPKVTSVPGRLVPSVSVQPGLDGSMAEGTVMASILFSDTSKARHPALFY